VKKIILSRPEYDYLVNNLLKGHKHILSKIKQKEHNDLVDIYVDDNVADDIRELVSDELVLHFDENYEPTKEGLMLESFIDKFYTG